MKKYLFLFAALALAAGCWQCNTTKYSSANLPTKQLHWGYGGGYAGHETSFILLENGRIFRREGVGGVPIEMKGTKRNTARALYSAFHRDLRKYDFNHPGNVYSFVQMQEGSAIRRVAWGDDRYPVEQKAKDFFNRINALVIDTN